MRPELPTVDVLGGDDAVLDHLDVLLSQGGIPNCELRIISRHPAEFLHRFDQVGDHFARVIVVVEAEPSLREHLAEQTAQEMIQFRRQARSVLLDPGAQPLVPLAQHKGETLLHLWHDLVEGCQRGTAVSGAVDDLGQQLRPHQIQAVNRLHQGVGHVKAGGADTPIWVGDGGQRQQAAGGGFVSQGARGAVGASGDVARFQPVGQREAQRVWKEGGQHNDLLRRDAFVLHQPGDLGGDPVEHFGVVAVVFVREWRMAHGDWRLFPGSVQAAGQLCAERFHIRRGDERLCKGYPLVAQVAEGVAALGVGAQEATVASLAVIDQQRRLAVGEPIPQQVVGHGSIFFDVVGDEVGVGFQQIIAAQRHGPQVVAEQL